MVFPIVVVPDTQNLIWRYSSVSDEMADWIKAQTPAAVIHVGDMVDWPRDEDWGRYAEMHDRMSGDWPISETVGNHDYDDWDDPQAQRDLFSRRGDHPVENFRRHIPLSKVKNLADTFPDGVATGNVVQTFEAEGHRFAIIALMCWPFDSELAWLESMINKYADRNVIINAHDYMNGTSRSNHGNRIWSIAKKYANVSFIFGGHYFPVAGHRSDRGDKGNTIHQVMVDYQNYEQRDPNTYVQIMMVDPETRTASVKTYSPVLSRYISGSSNDFMLANINLISSTPPIPSPGGGSMQRYPGVATNATGEKIITIVEKIAKHLDLENDFYVTSSLRNEPGSHHSGDRVFNGSPTVAVDIGFYDDAEVNNTDQLQARELARALIKYTRPHIVQLIHSTPFADDNGFYINEGADVAGSVFGEPNSGINGHVNHVHVVYSDASVSVALAQIDALLAGGSTPPPHSCRDNLRLRRLGLH